MVPNSLVVILQVVNIKLAVEQKIIKLKAKLKT